MVKRLSELPEVEARHLSLDRVVCPTFEPSELVGGPPLEQRRVVLISTAGLHKRGDRPFQPGDGSYRVIPADTPAADLVMSHISVNFDRTGFQQDSNVVFPIDRLRELVAEGAVGSMASVHYSFMGAFPPEAAEPHARHLAGLLKADKVDAALLVPV
ncbi:MAG TPA: glycine/sarcosine/betaine reductase selenoprotein B family protein [Reyranella sp.]|jgi:D-proline reductase (dithiol) PrdB|nr:glycine/sarcosine/betaine reductase selenoprotein B family protein [Reyranella sp.]